VKGKVEGKVKGKLRGKVKKGKEDLANAMMRTRVASEYLGKTKEGMWRKDGGKEGK
jgi:hypothetical protein